MALTRKSLAVMGIEEDKIDEIINLHSETVNGLKAEIDKYKEDAEKYQETSKKLEKAEKDLKSYEKNAEKDVFKVKYEELKSDFEAYKKDIADKESKSTKLNACREMLKEIGISDSRIDKILKVTDVDSIEFDEDGSVKDRENIINSFKEEWSDFVVTKETRGANVSNPPKNEGGKALTREEILKIKDTSKRQEAWKEYLNSGKEQ